jgi:galactokinase
MTREFKARLLAVNAMNSDTLPFELRELEQLLNRTDRDAFGLASFFTTGEIRVTRVPARLDVMGGIADYSGANVCEAVLGRGVLVGLQPRTDRTLRIRTMHAGLKALPVETRLPLEYFHSQNRIVDYAEIRQLCQANPLASWAAYIIGSIFTLLKEEQVQLAYGFNLLLLSAIPMNVGIGSSAAVEIGTLTCLNSYLGLNLSPARLAQLGQMAENNVVGAPCGIMDQTAITSGREGCLTHILCRPGEVRGEVEIPRGTGFVGINSMVRHSVAGSPYKDTRIGAFMGRKIINQLRVRAHRPAVTLSHRTGHARVSRGVRRRPAGGNARGGLSKAIRVARGRGHKNFSRRRVPHCVRTDAPSR